MDTSSILWSACQLWGELTPLDDASERIAPEQLHGHFDQAYGIFSGPAEHTAEIRFSAEAARWAAEEHWHPEQRTSFEADGSLRLSLPFGSSRELVMDILRYGADAEVIAPDFLREKLASEIASMQQAYATSARADGG